MCWKNFGAILLRSALLKSPVIINTASGCTLSCLHKCPYSSLSAASVSACGGMKTAVMTTAVNSLGNQNGWHRSMRYSRSGEQRDCIGCVLFRSHHELLIMKHTPPPLLFPERSGILSARCTEKPVGSMLKSGTSQDIQVSVSQIIEQSLISHWKEIRALSSQSLFSRDWTGQ